MFKKNKTKKESFMQGVLALMISQALIKLLGFAYQVYLTNKEGFGNDGNAIYKSGYHIYALLLTISSIGVPNAVSKLVSERISVGNYKGAHRIFKVALFTFAIIGLVASAILFFGAGAIASFNGIPEAELTLVALSPAIFFVAIVSVFRGYFNGMSKIKITANSQTLEQLFKTIFTIIVVEFVGMATGLNTTLMAAGANLATTLAVISGFVYMFSYFKFYKKEIQNEIVQTSNAVRDKDENKGIVQIIKSILFVSIPMSLSSILSSINRNVDAATVVNGIKKFASEKVAKNQYGILSGKVDTLGTLPLSFNIAFATALVPAISSAREKGDTQSIVKRISFSLLVTILIGLPSTVGMIIFADPILRLIFPNSPDGAFILQVCAAAIIFAALIQTINGALQGLGKIFVPAISLGIGVLVKLVLNIILTQISPDQFVFGGAAGAAFATVICQAIASAISFAVLSKTIKLNLKFSKMILKPIVATVIMAIISYAAYIVLLKAIIITPEEYTVYFNNLNCILPDKLATIILKIGKELPIILSLIIAVISYLSSVIVLKIFTKEEILMIPYGTKIYEFLQNRGIYRQKAKHY